MLEKQSVVDQIEITRDGHVQIRQADLYMENGVEMAKKYHRHVLSPGDDTINESKRVKVVTKAVWTPKVIEEYERRKKIKEKK